MRRETGDRPLTVVEIVPGSPAERLGIAAGDAVVSINGRPVRDPIDYRFEMADDEVILLLRGSDGAERRVIHAVEGGEDFGLVFEGLAPRECANRCVFCFVDQNPDGMRRTLYVRDEDYRFSFLFGHFITLTNLSEEDFRRIIEMRLSPLYVSVHSTNAVTRAGLLRRKRGADVMPPLRRLVDAGITVHTQVVVCPGINDGPDLDATLEDLAGLHPAVRSVAIVPVGLTAHRAGLAPLEPVTAPFARTLVPAVEAHRGRFRDRLGTGFAYLADEWFRILDLDPPEREYYDDFPLLENGVGMIRRFLDAVEEDGAEMFADIRAAGPRRVTCVTGTLFAPVLARVLRTAPCVPRGIGFDVLPAVNRFYGPSVHVAGLLVGGDIRDALRQAPVGDLVCVPAAALNGCGVFLDDVSIEDLKQDQGREVFADLSPFTEEAGWSSRHSLHGA